MPHSTAQRVQTADPRSSAAAKLRLASNPPLTYAYLASPPHSGSTLVACLLGTHPAISTVGEFGAVVPASGKCSCNRSYGECEFWRRWAAEAARQGIDFDIGNLQINLEPRAEAGFLESLFFHEFPSRLVNACRDLAPVFRPALRRRAERAVDKSARLAQILCDLEDTRVFLDITKNPLQVRFLSRRSDMPLKVISLLRDGRGVVNSLMRRYGHSAEKSIGMWLWGIRNTKRVAAQYLTSKQFLELKVEDLWAAPQDTCARLLRFLGVDDRVVLPMRTDRGRHVIGNRMRLHFDGHITPDYKWKTDLGPEARTLFEKRAGWCNRQLGYLD